MALPLTPLFIFLFSIPTIESGCNLFDKSIFEGFKSCLIIGGLSVDDIVERDNSESYNHLNYQWQLLPPSATPMAFILVQTEGNVEVAVGCGRKWNLSLIPKGGGHSLLKYSFGNSHSVVLDLRNLKTLDIHKSKMSVSVGTGWLFGPLIYELWKIDKVLIPFSDCPTVGVGGVATGGGWGFFARKFGMIADSILEARIVIANGTLLTANRKRNSDLFWALRGGIGSNFGVVTQLEFKIHPVPPSLFYGSLTFDLSQFAPVFDAWQRHVPNAPNSLTSRMDIQDGKIVIFFVDWTSDGSNYKILTKQFPKKGQIESTKIYSYPDYVFFNFQFFSEEILTPETVFESLPDLMNLNRESPGKIYQKRKSFTVTKVIGLKKLHKLKRFLGGMSPDGVVFFESYGGAINNVTENGTAFVHRGKTLYNTCLQYKSTMNNATADGNGVLWLEEYFEFSKRIIHHKESYQNYVDGEMKDYLERYFGSNLKRLVDVKRKYDPQNYWRNPQSIPTEL